MILAIIKRRVFSGCTSLVSISIPYGITTIERWSFSDCTMLSNITIPNSIENIGNYPFENCALLHVITYEGTKAQWESINKENFWSGDIKEVHCKDGIIKIV